MNGGLGGMMVMDGIPHGMHHHPQLPQPSHHPHMPAPITSSMNRSQRCGVCRGCQCKPCGQCTYCQDSPQFGGPGVKKQSCIERRCLRVLENRLQRDAPTFKARVGCNNCEDCRMPDCQICLVCLDKRFFENRYMTGAMCAKKRCNNATSIELPAASPHHMHDFHQRQVQKRFHDGSMQFDMKRPPMVYPGPMPLMMQHRHLLMPAPPPQYDMGMQLRLGPHPSMQIGLSHPGQPQLAAMPINGHPQLQHVHLQTINVAQLPPCSMANSAPLPPTPSPMPPTPSPPTSTSMTCQQVPPTVSTPTSCTALPPTSQHQMQEQMQEQQQHQQQQPVAPSASSCPTTQVVESMSPAPAPIAAPPPHTVVTMAQHMQPMLLPLDAYGMPYVGGNPNDFYSAKVDFTNFYMDDLHSTPNGDPFVPPSYAPDMKNAVVLQPL